MWCSGVDVEECKKERSAGRMLVVFVLVVFCRDDTGRLQ